LHANSLVWQETSGVAARILDGKALAAELRADLVARSGALAARGIAPRLAVVLVGDDEESAAYVRGIRRIAARVGVDVAEHVLPADAAEVDVRARLVQLGDDVTTHGVLLQQPLPRTLAIRAIADAVPVRKDVDGTNPANAGRLAVGTGTPFVPATPAAVMLLLERSSAWPLRGRDVTVVGRSGVVGLPVALLLIANDATVTVAHRGTADLRDHVSRADVIVTAAGKPGLITGDMLRPGATVIDVGTTVVDGAVVGDVDFESARLVAGEITPVPGGVGPVTNVALMRNVLSAAERLTAN
jgi:methylenetetrahydrofolate dehydrogenase (NADP+)/methenyltetrahydrofolate cyclohydrolase